MSVRSSDSRPDISNTRERERERDWKYIEMVTWPRWSNDHDNGSNKGSTCVGGENLGPVAIRAFKTIRSSDNFD